MIFLLLVAVALPGAVFGFTDQGRALLVDSGLGLGLGSPAPEVRVRVQACDYYHSTGRYGGSGWDCVFQLSNDGTTKEHAVELDGESEARLQQGAGTLMGAVGLYWPAGVLLSRWLDMMMLFVISGGLLFVCRLVGRHVPETVRLAGAPRGKARSVDLLSRGGRPWFAFVDDEGTRRFRQADPAAVPLHVDALLTNGIALVAGRDATLLYPSLWPLKLPEGERKAILARVDEIYRAGMVRKTLPPQQGDPETAAGRIDRIEAALATGPDAAALAGLYDEAWRLTWDNDDAALSKRIFDARDAIAVRLGPEAAWTALQRSRERFAGPQ